MDEDVDIILLSPFADIVEKAQSAIENAQAAGNADMLKAAQALLREGERGRKAIEPLARRLFAASGANFVAAVKGHDEIAERADALTELVYVFDDYTESDTFDAQKYKELGKCAQQAALRITAILKRMNLPAPPPQTPISEPDTPRTPSVVGDPFSGAAERRSYASSYGTEARMASSHGVDGARVYDIEILDRPPSVERSDTVVRPDSDKPQPREDKPIMGAEGGPDLGLHGGAQPGTSALSRNESQRSVASPRSPSAPEPASPLLSPPAPPPPPPAIDPWQIGGRLPVGPIPEVQEPGNEHDEGSGMKGHNADSRTSSQGGEVAAIVRRPHVSKRPDSPTLPRQSAPADSSQGTAPPTDRSSSSSSSPPQPAPRRLDVGVDEWQRQVEEQRPPGLQTSAHPSPTSVLVATETAPSPTVIVPAVSAVSFLPSQQTLSAREFIPSQQGRESVAGSTSAASQSPRDSRISTAESTNGSLFSLDSYYKGLAGPVHELPSTSPVSPDTRHPPQFVAAPNPSAAFAAQQKQPEEQSGLEPVQPVVIDSGLIPVETPSVPSPTRVNPASNGVQHPRPADCNIGPGSAFHLLKGFCEGAKEVQRGAAGVRQVKKVSYSGAGAYAAKCTHCFYELQWTEVEKDRTNQANANYRLRGIGFRLRFLSKSHLPAKQVDDEQYACLFCLQEGRTLEESDATVFFSQAQLFAHLARHPRPLPQVPGVTVIDGPERPPQHQNDYDLHFTLPPAHSELEGIRRELRQLPTATAVETFRKQHGTLRRPYDGVVPIQFPRGSKIVGIEFPLRYKGEWAVGWFDNVRGPFPAEAVRLDPPPKNEIRTQGTTALRATARWKWASGSVYRRSECDWLRLNKNETISNIVWSHPEHWCWAGTNSRGEWGYFPQSHIEPNSVKALPQPSDAGSILSQERSGSGLLSRFRSQNNHNTAAALRRPASIASNSTSTSH